MIIDTPAILKHYKPVDVPLPFCQGYVQCRKYVPLDSSRKAFLLFNCYFYTGVDKLARQCSLMDAMTEIPGGLPTFLCGDFNFVEYVDDSSSANPNLPPAAHLEKFHKMLDHFDAVEVPHAEHTYFHITSDVSSPYSHSARLDRVYIPAPLARSLIGEATVAIKPHHSNYRPRGDIRSSFSDHLPVELSFTPDVTENGNRPFIPTWLAQSPEFAAAMHEVWRPPISPLCPFKALAKFKAAMFKAAALTRKVKLSNASLPLSLSQHITLLRLISTVKQDVPRIQRLLEFTTTLDALVILRDGRYYDNGLEAAAQNLLVTASASTVPPPQPHPTTILKDKLPGTLFHQACV